MYPISDKFLAHDVEDTAYRHCTAAYERVRNIGLPTQMNNGIVVPVELSNGAQRVLFLSPNAQAVLWDMPAAAV